MFVATLLWHQPFITLSSCSCSPDIQSLKGVFNNAVNGDCRSIYFVDILQSVAVLLLALSSSRDDDMCSPASLDVAWRPQLKDDASLYSFPVTLRYFVLRKTCILASSLNCLWWWWLHRTLTWPAGVLCALLYRCGRSHCLRLQRNATTASYRTM